MKYGKDLTESFSKKSEDRDRLKDMGGQFTDEGHADLILRALPNKEYDFMPQFSYRDRTTTS